MLEIQRTRLKAVFIGFAISLLWGCTNENSSKKLIEVPLDENIPYNDVDHLRIDKSVPTEGKLIKVGTLPHSDSLPPGIVNLHKYIFDPTPFEQIKLDAFVGDEYQVIPLDEDRFMLLDIDNDQLIEIYPQENKSITLAEFGRGPGDLAFSKDLATDGNLLYIARADRKVSVYDCATKPCHFKELINIGVEAFSIDLVDKDSIAVQGALAIEETGGGPTMTEMPVSKAVYVFSKTGDAGPSFGKTYNTEGHWMLLRPFVSEGNLQYMNSQKMYIVSFNRFPFLYFFGKAGDFVKALQIEEFVLGHQEYSPETGRLQIVLVDHSVISNTSVIEDNFLLVEVTHRSNNRVENHAFVWDIYRDYYCIDIAKNISYYLGQLRPKENAGVRLSIVDGGLVVENRGDLFFARR